MSNLLVGTNSIATVIDSYGAHHLAVLADIRCSQTSVLPPDNINPFTSIVHVVPVAAVICLLCHVVVVVVRLIVVAVNTIDRSNTVLLYCVRVLYCTVLYCVSEQSALANLLSSKLAK